MSQRIALVTSNPLLVHRFVEDHALHRELGIEIPLAVHIQPSMRFLDRLRDLRRTIVRQARINKTNVVAQFLHHFAYRPVARIATSGAMEPAVRSLAAGRRILQSSSVNDPAVAEAVAAEGCSLVLVVGSDVLSRRTLTTLPRSIYNVHYSDPAFVRGLPPVFWEIIGGRESIQLTFHELTSALDAGPVVAQREVPIVWRLTLEETLLSTRDATVPALSEVLADGILKVRSGASQTHSVPAGPLRTTPTVTQIREARRICGARARSHRQRS